MKVDDFEPIAEDNTRAQTDVVLNFVESADLGQREVGHERRQEAEVLADVQICRRH